MKYLARLGDRRFVLGVEEVGGRTFVDFGDGRREVDMVSVGEDCLFSVLVDGVQKEVALQRLEDRYSVSVDGVEREVLVEEVRKRRKREGVAGKVEVKAPMPGLIVAVEVGKGQKVCQGEGLLVLEAMKMQNEIKSPRDGVVTDIQVEKGNTVAKGAVLLTIE